ncbi:hypothetical protein VTH06DRAFT_6222 [Thermothelomyces fergusii]
MKSLSVLVMAFCLLVMALAVPLVDERDGVQTVHLIFHAGPAEYSLAIPADGSVHQTNSDLAVNIVDAPDYNALYQCEFETQSNATLAGSISPEGSNQILVGPPTPVLSVSCQGTCVYTYGDCYRDGQWLGPCCAGYCAANKCRPWISPWRRRDAREAVAG